jgi:hypothetical protein
MITEITNTESLKEIFVETLLNKTDKVTKVTDGSVLNGVAFGVAKLAQKTLKDIAVIEAHLFSDSAYGQYLDDYAALNGISVRAGAAQSSLYIFLSGTPGTFYQSGIQTFGGNNGIVFDLENDTTIPAIGWTYTKIRSQQLGSNANVDALTINKVTPVPVGHSYCINEYSGGGGRDVEDDDTYRQRIREEINSLARQTLSYLEQVFMKINPNVLRIFNLGYNQLNEVILGIATVNGIDLSPTEMNDFIVKGEKYFSISDMRPNNGLNFIGVELRNIDWQPIDISFRCDIDGSYNIDTVRKAIQVNLNKTLDYRFWDWTKKIEWDDLLQIVKATTGVVGVLDTYFYPNQDIVIDKYRLPRIRGFRMLDYNGSIITDIQGILNPIYFPSNPDFAFQSTVLATI